MRILVVSPTPSHPQDAGNRARIHAVLSDLKAAGHSITLCLLDREKVAPEHLDSMRDAWDELILVPHDRAQERPSLGGSFGLDDWVQPALEDVLVTLAVRRPGFDMVLVEYVFLSRAFTFFPPPNLRFAAPVLKVLDTHDQFGGRDQRLRALGLNPSFYFTTQAEEARGFGRADLVLAIQDEERAAFEAYSPKPVLTLGHLPAGDRPPLPPRAPDGRFVIGYLGSSNPMNTRALDRFLAALDLPALAAAGAEIRIAGSAAGHLQAAPGLALMGPVADPDDLYAAVDLVVNPHEGGTGLKIKTVEALSRGRPVAGTAEAFAGLEPQAAFHAAADAMALAGLVQRAVQDPALRPRIAAASATLWRRYSARVAAEQRRLASPAMLRLAMDRPRTLLVTDLRFWEERLGNHARIAALARAARTEMDLDLFFIGTMSPSEISYAKALLGGRSRIFPTGALPPTPDARLPPGLTPFERRSTIAAALPAFASHLAANPPDAVVLEYIRLSYLRHAIHQPVLTVLDTHDIMSLRARNFAHFGRRHFIEISVQEELRILSGFDQLLAIQQDEFNWLDALLPGRVMLAPHVVSVQPRAPRDAEGPVRVGFIGGDSPMNRDGLTWLLDQVWPAIAPLGAELHVAGDVCTTMPAGRPGVVLHGAVPRPEDFLTTLDIGVNPVFYGGGLKIKTVEYLSHGLPSVLTAEALYGITGGAGEAYALAEDRAGFVAQLAGLVLDPAARLRMGEAALAFGRRHFAPAALAPAMRNLAGLARGVPRPAAAARA
ncbi:glycosyltransferase family 4 protein [Roseomonas frigidaquae]|uniref:Glycosyltransferase family 4 protein n=1 Tax=Falsiroseomonas frigidaquae TaxID=487318 RepID=A0ABX1F5X3_9PROT|nr:glycosyltransferase [Falsiroseomonas frigidaquae]NKE47692.1 glycosyltransferase family 4 protein [Falsiroseomonas frigidaquae]